MTQAASIPVGAYALIKASDVVAEARKWDGVRWRHQGRSRSGIDCAGLVINVAKSLGLSGFDTCDYGPQASDESMLRLCREHLIEVGRNEMAPGDVIVMRFGTNRHLGIAGDYRHGGLSIIHAFTPIRRVTESRYDENWLRQMGGSFLACFRFPGVTP